MSRRAASAAAARSGVVALAFAAFRRSVTVFPIVSTRASAASWSRPSASRESVYRIPPALAT
ncbi:Uncharacterised protein [Amycolatopsis camponoti]|uniref:Secreted protein n=1 Tax=Amycolatopsis camponoti TaxID=2606593 RepID=A0A6I8LJ62_9PSEU|nr:Uncharacterised protein [Amycolatopsis camponoti]